MSSNEKMVMVPFGVFERWRAGALTAGDSAVIGRIADQPAEQHQAYPSEDELIANGLGYPIGKEDAVKLHYAGYRSEVITVLEAWEAIGHDTGINPDKQELMESLRNMAAICAAHGFDMPADQPHGEPEVLPERWTRQHFPAYMSDDEAMVRVGTWNACLDEIAKLGPLYSRPVQGEPIGMLYRIDGEVVIQAVGDPHIKDGMLVYTHADPGEVTLQQIMQAYEYAESHPHKYLRGTTNWLAAIAWHLNKNRGAQAGE